METQEKKGCAYIQMQPIKQEPQICKSRALRISLTELLKMPQGKEQERPKQERVQTCIAPWEDDRMYALYIQASTKVSDNEQALQ